MCHEKFGKIHRKTPVQESVFNKVAGWWFATLLKKKLLHRHFPFNFCEILDCFFSTHYIRTTSKLELSERPQMTQCALVYQPTSYQNAFLENTCNGALFK